ncbi:hypothetical protein YTPLAS73_09140 [Nitrosarchaeum sp.]|nr:hypothetical protein YTPLAS73_09140 [Nitrosarchaeum sp.]
MNNQICRIVVGTSSIEFESVEAQVNSNLQTLIESDKKFRVIQPKNGKTITWGLKNTDTELSYSQMKKIVQDVCFAFSSEFKLDFDFTTDYKNADVKISFAAEDEDSNLTSNTIAYMGYPLSGSQFYGICVINKKWIFTHDGRSRTGYELTVLGIQVQFLDGNYATLYLVKILIHEFGHGVLGLQHDTEPGSIMSSNEGAMSDKWSNRDLTRGYAKVPKNTKENPLKTRLARLRAWFLIGGRR